MMQLIQSGGVQVVTKPQIVYLDFDGEQTSYNGELLTIDHVTVEDSGLTAERITAITARLNAEYAERNVIFVTERPLDEKFSTIYIGKTSSFEQYGNFAGLAETIDTGNRNQSDNAFVNLDTTASDQEIINTISHEVDHIVFGSTHPGEGLEQYGSTIYYYYNKNYTGILFSSLTLSHYGSSDHSIRYGSNPEPVYSVTYYDKGQNITIASGGKLTVGNGGGANGVTIHSGASMWISSGGTANEITLDIGGAVIADSYCSASNVTNKGGVFTIYQGANVENIVLSGGVLVISSGGVASGVDVVGGRIYNSGIMALDSAGPIKGEIYNSGTMVGLDSVSIESGGNLSNGQRGSMVLNSINIISGGRLDNAGVMVFDTVTGTGQSGFHNTGIMTLSSASFVNNSADVYNNQGIITIGSASFVRNSSYSHRGGAIYNTGSMSLGSAGFVNNSVGPGGSGGAIYNAGSMTLTTVVFTGNVGSRNVDGFYGNGGAIHNIGYGSMDLGDNAIFDGNSGNQGGAIYNSGILTLGNNAMFIENSGDLGGAINNYGNMTLTSATFAKNMINASFTSFGWGGAIHNALGGAIYNAGKMTLTAVDFTGNAARIDSGGSVFGGSAYGGAIYNSGNAIFTLTSVTFAGNMASAGSGFALGGAVYNLEGNMVFSSATFWGNSVNVGSGSACGGAIYNDYKGKVTLADCRFETYTDTIYIAGGQIITEGTVSFAGNVVLGTDIWYGSHGILTNNGMIDLNIASREESDGILLNDWQYVYGEGNYSITVSAKQFSGAYQLIGNVVDFDKTITVYGEDGTKWGELSLDMDKSIKLHDIDFRLLLDEKTQVVSVLIDSPFSKGTDREKRETEVKLPDYALAALAGSTYSLQQAPEWLTIDAATGKFGGTTGKITDTATGYGTTEVIVAATSGEEVKTHTIDVVVVPENIKGDGVGEKKNMASMTDVVAEAVKKREVRGEVSLVLDDVYWLYYGMGISLTDLSVTTTVSNIDYAIKLQGKAHFEIFEPVTPNADESTPQMTVDLSGGNYIMITTPHDFESVKFDIVGALEFSNLTLHGGFFLTKGTITVNTETQVWTGDAEVLFGFWGSDGITIKGYYEVVETKANKITLEVDGLNIAMGTTGFFLTGLMGGVDNLAVEGGPVEFIGGVDFVYGKEITISLPSIIGFANGTYSIAKVELDGQIDRNHVSGGAALTMLGGIVTGDMELVLDWSTGVFSASGSMSLLGGITTVSGGLKLDSKGNFTVNGSSVVDFGGLGFDLLGGLSREASVQLAFSNDGNQANDYFMAWTTINVLGTSGTVGIRIGFDGSTRLIGAEDVANAAVDSSPLKRLAGTESMMAENSAVASQTWNLTGYSGVILLTAEWESGDAVVSLSASDGRTYTLAEISQRQDIEVVQELSTANKTVIAVNNPAAGNWGLNVSNAANVTFAANSLGGATALATPVLSVSAGTDRTIQFSWTCANLPSDAVISIYYDSDNKDYDGLLAATITPTGNSGVYQWTIPDMAAGNLYFYALATSANAIPVLSGYSTAIQVEAVMQTITVNSSAWNYVNSGYQAVNAQITSGGILEVGGGSVSGANIECGGRIEVSEAAVLRGKIVLAGQLRLGSEAVVDASGAELVFTLGACGDSDEIIIRNINGINNASYAISLVVTMAEGRYKLASGAAGFAESISVYGENSRLLGTFTATQRHFSSDGRIYILSESSGILSLNIAEKSTDIATNLLENGYSQIVAWDSAGGKVGYVATNGQVAPAWAGIWEWGVEEAAMWKVVGVGRFSADVEHDGILLYNGIGNTFAAWTDLGRGDYGYVSLCHVDGNFQTLALADFDNNGLDDVIIFDEKGSFGIVSDAAAYHDVWHVDNATTNVQKVIGAGYFGNADGKSDILVKKTDENAYFLWHNQDSTFNTWNWSQTYIGTLDNDWVVAAIGDFQGDGVDDIIMWQKSTGYMYAWEDGKSSNQRWVGQLDASQWEVAAVGDYNGDGKEDLLLRELVSGWGGVGYWAGANASNWTDLNARIETDMESKFAVIA